jgi:hypothetical protein
MSTVLPRLGLLLLLATVMPARAATFDWPFPEFTSQAALEVKNNVGDALISVAAEGGRKYVLVAVPLDDVKGSLADVAAAAMAGSGTAKLKETRRTETRVYLTRGTEWASLYAGDIRAFPAEVVIELDKEGKRLVAYEKLDVRGAVPTKGDWKALLVEALSWKLAAEGK